ncbi:MAG: aminotransferase class V-fold PLP-dependent enzyme [Candidatus Aenigmarchaeota archaeon]|nr:aminotransferase class V-fold PLP-dependent enzyme [Candidatus Aenigmarchaeota archaeon]
MNLEKIRQDFPALNQMINGKPPIYFDNSCMTLKPIQVIDAMNEYYMKYPACHGRSTHKFAKSVTEKFEEARRKMRAFINADSEKEVLWTRNTTEGLNLIARTLDFKEGDTIITTDIEHNSNLLPWQWVAKNYGAKHIPLESNEDVTFNLERFQETMNKSVKLVSVVHTSNVTGVTIPLKEITKIAHEFGALVAVDAAQSAPHIPLDVKKLDVDFLALSVHKMAGPTGMGVLYGKQHILEEMPQFLVGGETVLDSTYETKEIAQLPDKFEAGLQNYSGAIGAGAAAEYLKKIGLDNIHNHELGLNGYLTKKMEEFEGVNLLGPKDAEKRGGIYTFVVEGVDSHELGMLLDEAANIMMRSGAHCVHSWFNKHNIPASIRASFYLYNTKEEIDVFIEKFRQILDFAR